MSDLKPPSQKTPGVPPTRARTAMRRASLAFPTPIMAGCPVAAELFIDRYPVACSSKQSRSVNASRGYRPLAVPTPALYVDRSEHFTSVDVVGVTKMPRI